MAFWRRFLRVLPQRRTQFSSPLVVIDAALQAARGEGAFISRTEALTVPGVLRGRNMLASIATLPLVQRGPDRRVIDNPLFRQLDPDVANVVTLAQTVEDLVFDAVSWWRITAFGADGYPVSVRHLDVNSVSLTPPSRVGSPTPLPSGIDPHDAVVYVDGIQVPVSQMIRFDSPNPAVLSTCGRSIRRALLLDKAAQMYADDPRPADYFSPADGADPVDDDDVADILSKWKTARKKRSTAWVPAAMKYNTVDSPSPADLQLVELQRQAALDIANALGIDPEDLGVSTTSRTYQNDVDRRRNRVNEVLAPYMRAVTDRLSMGDVTKRGHSVEFNLNDYLKSNPSERANVQKTYVDMGVLSEDEVREAEGYAGSAPGKKAEPQPQPAEDPNPDEEAAVAAARRVLQRFSMRQHFDTSGLTFANLPMTTFKVDPATRTIEGLGLLYNVVGNNGAAKFKFVKGSLSYGDVSRVKLLRDHDMTQPLGKATRLKDTSAGFAVAFKVARGAEGDRALELAEDGVLDGLSVGVDIEEFDIDPKDNSVYLIHKATLREVSLTAMPAFDDARVTSVAASRHQGDAMEECATCGQRHAPGVACQTTTPPAAGVTLSSEQLVTLTSEQFDALLRGVSNTSTTVPAEPEQRQVVDPTRRPLNASVTEPAPYRFDRQGNIRRGTHEFSTDLIAGLRDNDTAAYNRVMTALRQQFDISTDDVNELNPTRQRPDLYVDQQEYTTPVWDMINKGTLTDITPFAYPKFNSSASLVGAHTEGQEPSAGSFTTTGGTVTPTALSGRVEITRETWDQGGNPQVSNLIWRQIVRAWNEGLEQKAVDLLDTASCTGTGSVLTAGLTDKALDAALTSFLVEQQFQRGGFHQRAFPVNKALYKALASAVDDDGRKLFPVIGPTNATGTASPYWNSLNVNGLAAVPAWALPTSTSAYSSSYLFDPEDVSGWATAPQRLQFEYRVAYIDLAVWGYVATAGLRTCSAIDIQYDPTA